jgi:hypothetical protein
MPSRASTRVPGPKTGWFEEVCKEAVAATMMLMALILVASFGAAFAFFFLLP